MGWTPREHQQFRHPQEGVFHLHELQPSVENTVKMRVELSGSHWHPSTSSDETDEYSIHMLSLTTIPHLTSVPVQGLSIRRASGLLFICHSLGLDQRPSCIEVGRWGSLWNDDFYSIIILIFHSLSPSFSSRTDVLRIIAFYTGTWSDMTGPLLFCDVP